MHGTITNIQNEDLVPIYHFTKQENIDNIQVDGLKSKKAKGRHNGKRFNPDDEHLCFTPFLPEQNINVLNYGDIACVFYVNPENVYINDQEDLGKITNGKDYTKITLREFLKIQGNKHEIKEIFGKEEIFPEVRITQNPGEKFVPQKFIDYKEYLPKYYQNIKNAQDEERRRLELEKEKLEKSNQFRRVQQEYEDREIGRAYEIAKEYHESLKQEEMSKKKTSKFKLVSKGSECNFWNIRMDSV